ncbi:MAG: hypothetical protein LUC34_05340 [Campylobacter sp.]|nr:hypothetical protein [Campylobacter sp.]
MKSIFNSVKTSTVALGLLLMLSNVVNAGVPVTNPIQLTQSQTQWITDNANQLNQLYAMSGVKDALNLTKG